MRKKFLLAAPAIIPNLFAVAEANTLTSLIPTLFAALNTVSRELVGIVPAVTRNVSAERAAVGETVMWPIAPTMPSSNIVPAMTIPEPADVVIGNATLAITKAKSIEFGWTGEEQRGVDNGVGWNVIQADLFAEGLRTLVNEMENDLFVEAAANISVATGTPGTTPFATNVGDSAQVRKLLDDAGASPSGRSLIGDTSMGAALRTLANLTKVNEAGTTLTLRDGELLQLNGLSIKESGQAGNSAQLVMGTAAGATTNAAGYAVGATVITLAAAGTGTILAGDLIAFAGDNRYYKVASGDADVSNAGTITLAAPGLREPIAATATAITVARVAGGYQRNVAFPQSAMALIARVPALPNGQDAAFASRLITDPRSGLTFEIRLYNGYRKVRAEVGLAWGVKAIKPRDIVGLLG